MERALPFLVVEFPSRGFVMTRFTRSHPLCTIDLISQAPTLRGDEPTYPTLFLAKGIAWREFHELLEQLARAHSKPEVLRRDAAGLTWLCHVDIRTTHLGEDAKALAQFQDRFGPPWIHIEQGVFHMRARLADATNPERLVHQLTGFLEATGVEAQVEVQALGPGDYGVWEELLQAAAGFPRAASDA